jgi:glycerophosphoryl diester phosphodiesterase
VTTTGSQSGPFLTDPTAPSAMAVIGHRGSGVGLSPRGHRENSIASFLEAVDDGATWVECDVQATTDHVLLLCHNVGSEGVTITEHPLADVASHRWSTLAGLHAALPRHVGIDVEIKVGLPALDGSEPTVEPVLDWIARRAHRRPWLVTSFDPTVVLAARARGLNAGWLTNADWPLHEHLGTAARLGATVIAAHAHSVLAPKNDHLTPAQVIAAAAARGIQVLTWGASAADVPALTGAGVTAICVNDVAATAAAVRRMPALIA